MEPGPTLQVDYCHYQRSTDDPAQLNSLIDATRHELDITELPSPDRPNLLTRLAAALAARVWSHQNRLTLLDRQARSLEAAGNRSSAQRLRTQLTSLSRGISQERQEAISAYGEVIRATAEPLSGQNSLLPEPLFELACLHLQGGAIEPARDYLKRLVARYPDDRLAPRAYGILGAQAYAQGTYQVAIQLYNKALRFPTSPFYGYDLYGKAWAQLRQGSPKDAQSIFIEAVDYALNPQRTSTGLVDEKLAAAAREGAAISYAQSGSTEDAWTFAQRAGRDQAPAVMELLARSYLDLGRTAERNQIYRKLVTANPVQSKQCTWQLDLVKSLLSASQRQPSGEILSELKRLAGISEQLESVRYLPPAVIGGCRHETAELLADVAQAWHAAGVRADGGAALDAASQIYLLCLRTFPSARSSNELRLKYAELLSWLGEHARAAEPQQSCQAAERLREVVQLERTGTLAERAAYARILATRHCVGLPAAGEDFDYREALRKRRLQYPGPARSGGPGSSGGSPDPIPEKWQKLLSAYEAYLGTASNTPKLAPVKFWRARIYYAFNHLREAMDALQDLATQHPSSEIATGAVILWSDCFEALLDADAARAEQEQAQMERLLERMGESVRRTTNPEVQTAMAGARCSLEFQKARRREQTTDPAGSAAAYERAAGGCPAHVRSPPALFRAIELWTRAKQPDNAARAAETLVSQYKTDPLARPALYHLADYYESIRNLRLAAEKLELFAASFWEPKSAAGPRDKGELQSAALALYRAARLRRQLPQPEVFFFRDVEQFVGHYGGLESQADLAAELWIERALILEEQGALAKAEQSLAEYLDRWPKKGGFDWQIAANTALGAMQRRGACPRPERDQLCVTEYEDPQIQAALLRAIDACKQQLPALAERPPQLRLRREFKYLRRDDNHRLTDALALFISKRGRQALASLRKQHDGAARARQATHYAALAKLLIIDATYELHRLDHRDTPIDYAPVQRLDDAFFKVAAMARAGQYQLDLALDLLSRAPQPRFPAACTAEIRRPLELIARAKAQFANCFRAASASEQQSSPWGSLCYQQARLLRSID